MTELQRISKSVGRSFLVEELDNDFRVLRHILNPRVQSALGWLSELNEGERARLLTQVFDEDGKGPLADIYFALTSGQVGPRFVFQDRKKLLKHFLGKSEIGEFSHIDGETIMAFWDVGQFKVVTSITASDRLFNIECSHIVKSGDPQMSGPFSLLGAIELYHSDCWKSDNLELEASIQGVSVILREGCQRLRAMLETAQ
jgi:hypothetical protein